MKKPTNSLQLIGGGRLSAANAQLHRNRLRERVVRERRALHQGLHEISGRHRIGHNEVLTLLEEQFAVDDRLSYERGFRDGRIAERYAPRAMPAIRRAA